MGESNFPACGPPANFPAHLDSSYVTPAGSVHKSRGAVEDVLQNGRSGDGCDLASTFCSYNLRKGATTDAEKYLFKTANVCWRCAQYFVIAFSDKMPRGNICRYMAHVCFLVCCRDNGGQFVV